MRFFQIPTPRNVDSIPSGGYENTMPTQEQKKAKVIDSATVKNSE
tara:strand:- start:735 stop:869 length:135 start_codon:yes stop_codon:yes gene_type:complete